MAPDARPTVVETTVRPPVEVPWSWRNPKGYPLNGRDRRSRLPCDKNATPHFAGMIFSNLVQVPTACQHPPTLNTVEKMIVDRDGVETLRRPEMLIISITSS